jgi:hypothetical protein
VLENTDTLFINWESLNTWLTCYMSSYSRGLRKLCILTSAGDLIKHMKKHVPYNSWTAQLLYPWTYDFHITLKNSTTKHSSQIQINIRCPYAAIHFDRKTNTEHITPNSVCNLWHSGIIIPNLTWGLHSLKLSSLLPCRFPLYWFTRCRWSRTKRSRD